MTHELVSCEDTALLRAEDPAAQLQIGALCFFEGSSLRDDSGSVRIEDLRTHVTARLADMPRFRQRIATLPFDAARPVWVDDEHFAISNHIKVAHLDGTGDRADLRGLVNDLLSTRLEPEHPLWDMTFVDGMTDGTIAGVLRVHHVMADGLALLDAAMLLLDSEPNAEPDAPRPWVPSPSPGTAGLLVRSLANRASEQVRLGVGLWASTTRWALDPRRVLSGARGALNAVASLGSSVPATAPALSITGRIGPMRDMNWSSLDMADLLDIKRARGTTINDVVLAITAGAIRSQSGGESEARQRRPRVLVPVGNVGAPAGDGAGNRFSMVLVDLPIDLDDPLDRLASIHDQMTRAKSAERASATSRIFSLVDLVPLRLIRAVLPEALARQPFVNLALTNIPGSRTPGYLLGSRLTGLHPIVTGVGNIAAIIAVLSYVDSMGVGITVDPAVVDDPDALMDSFLGAATELLDACR